ncbi:NTP transferase domain-containing protein [candidate division KSB1 bacterium]|nr:NTP transferase domain-containing protein [candidate division KSB1 bacterium]
MSQTLAMILAGGVGKRLSILSKLRAKPAVPFGGIYRIIDFTLSNVMNSGVNDVAVLPQYRPLSLVEHIGIGVPWDFNGRTRSISILSPSTGKKDSDWYRGTADALRQNLDHIQHFGSKYVLLLSGDHIYKMDYGEIINYHKDKDADVTVAMIDVPLGEAHQYGIGTLDSNGKIDQWFEKPKDPPGNLASMGVYVFSTNFLIEQLQKLSGDDFGHDLIPVFVERYNAFGFVFKGYWRDVGTVKAYWETNMDILHDSSGLNLKEWDVATNFDEEGRVGDRPPAFISSVAEISNSMLAQGCKIMGTVENSIISPGVFVGADTVIRNSIILHDTHIKNGSQLDYCIIDKDVEIGNSCILGDIAANPDNLCLIGKHSFIPDNVKIGKFCKVYPRTDLSKQATLEYKEYQEIGTPI